MIFQISSNYGGNSYPQFFVNFFHEPNFQQVCCHLLYYQGLTCCCSLVNLASRSSDDSPVPVQLLLGWMVQLFIPLLLPLCHQLHTLNFTDHQLPLLAQLISRGGQTVAPKCDTEAAWCNRVFKNAFLKP